MTCNHKINYRDIVSSDSFIGSYLEWRKDAETPDVFDFWCAMRALSHVSADAYIARPKRSVNLHCIPVLVEDDPFTRRQDAYDALASVYSSAYNVVEPFKSVTSTSVRKLFVDGSSMQTSVLYVLPTRRTKSVAWEAAHNTAYADTMNAELNELRRLITLSTKLQLSPDAVHEFTTWYTERPYKSDIHERTFDAVADEHVLRIAGLLAVNDMTRDIRQWQEPVIVLADAVRTAIRLVHELRCNYLTIFQDRMSTDKLEHAIELLRRRLLRTDSPVKRTTLYRSVQNYVDRDTFALTLDVMHELGLVTKYVPTVRMRSRMPTYYVATELLRDDDKVTELLTNIK